MRRSSLSRQFVVAVACVLALTEFGIRQGAAAVQNRIAHPVSSEQAAEIQGSVSPHVKNARDLGPAAADTRLHMVMRFSMTADQQTALDQLLADQQNPASPRYHQWLTPAQFGGQFGLSSADISKVTAWLANQGFTVTEVAQGGTFVAFEGTVRQAEAAFGTSIRNVSYKGQTYFANVTNASVPVALATVVSVVNGLHNFRLRPHAAVVRPHFTSSISGNHYMAPGDIYAIYQMNGLLNGGMNGQGIKIAVTGQVDINTADVSAFLSAAGLSTANLPTTIHVGGDPGTARNCSATTNTNCPVPNQDDLAEAAIDLEWSSAMAPGATILFVNGPDIFDDALTQAIDQNVAPIVTTSYGACEAAEGSTELNALNQVFKQASAQGQTVVAASGDVGATDCDGGTTAANGLAADFPASSPYVTGIGGTSYLDGSATGPTQYWNSNESGSVSNAGSALGYIPETIWNDTPSIPEAGGGGASGFFSKPAWQSGPGVPADAVRDVPDLSMNASATHDPFMFCVNVSAGESCTDGFRLASDSTVNVAGGTSIDSQIFGGMLAVLEQKLGQRLGNINPALYALGNNSTYYNAGATILTNSNVVFNDVTTGNNKMPCSSGTPNCPSGGTIGYSSGTGYDLTSGWGSPNLYNMANAWTKVLPLSSGSNGTAVSSTTVTATPSSAAAGTTVTIRASVSGSAGTPTGTVTFLINGSAINTAALNSSGVATYTYATSCSNLAALAAPRLMPPAQSGVGHFTGRSVFGMASGASLACLMLITIPRKRRLSGLLVCLVCIGIIGSAAGCGGGTAIANPAGSNSTTSGTPAGRTGQLVVQASYSGNSVYAGSVGSGITAAGITTTATPVEVTITQGGC